MTRGRGEADLRVRGIGLKRRFVQAMTLALTVVMLLAAFAFWSAATRIHTTAEQEHFIEAAKLTMRDPPVQGRGKALSLDGVEVQEVSYGQGGDRATVYRVEAGDGTDRKVEILVPPATSSGDDALIAVILIVTLLVILVGALVAFWVAGKVTRPVETIIDDVRHISHGELDKRIRAEGGGEIELLARSIERMTRDLQEAQEAMLELSVRERELALAADVHEALVPVATPLVEGYDVAAVHVSSPRIGGDFHDYVEMVDGRLGLLVCDVSGSGMPAALIGATARSYLRSELAHLDEESGAESMARAFARVNRWLCGDVRRGVYVTALYALIDPERGQALVLSAGHKVPLVRISAEDGQLRTVHPEGIAMGLDRGPVFEQKLQTAIVPLEPGDRFFLCNSAPVQLEDAEGRELGERAFYGRVLKHSGGESPAFLKALRGDLYAYAGEDGVVRDISLVTISREA